MPNTVTAREAADTVRIVLEKVLADALENFRPEDGDLYPHAEADAVAALDVLVSAAEQADTMEAALTVYAERTNDYAVARAAIAAAGGAADSKEGT